MPAIICPVCKLKNPGTAMRCDCGFRFAGTPFAPPAAKPAAPTSPSDLLAPKLRELFGRAGVDPALFDALGTLDKIQLSRAWLQIGTSKFESVIPVFGKLEGLPLHARARLVAWAQAEIDRAPLPHLRPMWNPEHGGAHAETSVAIELLVRFAPELSLVDVSHSIAAAMTSIGAAPMQWSAMPNAKPAPGGHSDLERHVRARGDSEAQSYFTLVGERMSAVTERDATSWLARFTTRQNDASPEWIETLLAVVRGVRDTRGLRSASVVRVGLLFPCVPPLAEASHAVTVTDADVADAYEDPHVFWDAWDKVEPYGDMKLCTRALDDVDLCQWLGKTYESTMALARAAKPGKTVYATIRPIPALSAWWELGPWDEDKAGEPTLSPVRYDEATRMLEFAAYVPPQRHVLIQEIQIIRTLALKKKDGKGRPIDEIQIVFIGDTPEATARAERRPLRDVGARTFFLRPDGTRVEVM